MIIGIDVGGTKTHIRVADATASRELRLPTVQWLRGRSLEHPASVAALLDAVASIAPDAELLGAAPLVVGAHGCDTPEQITAFHEALADRHSGPIAVTNDAALVGPAAGVDRAIGVIAGTGSIVVGADAAGTPVTAGGHGWMIADPASAPGIVREAVRAVILRADTGAVPDQLGEALMLHYGADDVNELAWVFMVDASIHRWAEAAPIVFEAADSGSTDAVATIERAAAELVTQVTQVLTRGAVADAIVAAGGVVTNQPRLASALERELARQGVDHPFRVLDRAPVAGAVALGARLRPRVERAAGTEHGAVPEASALT
jgi:N-acetylglucosamine kinase-like BadF-type ATPase